MSRRHAELALWSLAMVLALAGWTRWRNAAPPVEAAAATAGAAPVEVRALTEARLSAAAAAVAAGNPFRLDRAPAPIGYAVNAPEGDRRFEAPTPPPPPRPQLGVSGISGPPWGALLTGVPGREGSSVFVSAGDTVGDLRIRSVTRDRVVVQGPDTTWTLTVSRQWQ